MVLKINNKMKKFFGGNWGKPDNYEQSHTKVPDEFFEDKEVKHFSKKKKKKKPFVFGWKICPFCQGLLEELPNENSKKYYVIDRYKQECSCGAKGNHICPACKRDTWHKDFIYKHQWIGCGFEGAKKYENTR